jgi:hypothetical protein
MAIQNSPILQQQLTLLYLTVPQKPKTKSFVFVLYYCSVKEIVVSDANLKRINVRILRIFVPGKLKYQAL